METKNIINEAIKAASTAGLSSRVENLRAEETRLLEPRYRVAFVGQFKTGKSTLINKLILKKDLLFTDLMEATSIPVEIDYSDTPRLELYRYEKASAPPVEGNGGNSGGKYITGIALDQTIIDPTTEQIKQYTSGDTPEQRAALASSYSHARLFWPAANLRQFTVVDTPGINTPNDAVATATYRILPECDMAIFVTPPRQLSSVDLQFLRSHVFDSGITRGMVVLLYDPRFVDLDADQLSRITQDVEAALANIGRDSIPVVVAEVARTGPASQDGLGKAVTQAPDAWLNEPAAASASTAGSTLSGLELDLIRFIQENIQPGREEKIRRRLRPEIESALAECQVELGLLEQDATTRQKIISDIQAVQQTTKREQDEIKQDILADLHLLQATHSKSLLTGFDGIEQRFRGEVEACDRWQDVQERLAKLRPILQTEVDSLALETRKAISEELKQLEQKYVLRLRDTSQQWRELDVALKIDGGLLEKIPSWVVVGLDWALVFHFVLNPFSLFIDIPLRLLAGQIPGLKALLPANLAKAGFKTWIVGAASKQFDQAKKEVQTKLQEAYQETERKLEEQWRKLASDQEQAINAATSRASQTPPPERQSELRDVITSFKQLLSQLPA